MLIDEDSVRFAVERGWVLGVGICWNVELCRVSSSCYLLSS